MSSIARVELYGIIVIIFRLLLLFRQSNQLRLGIVEFDGRIVSLAVRPLPPIASSFLLGNTRKIVIVEGHPDLDGWFAGVGEWIDSQ